MSPLLVLIAVSTLGVEVGWQPLADGGHEYTIQLEPTLVERMKQDDLEITSEVPPQLDVRRYRIVVGTGKVPREGGAAPAAKAAPPSAKAASPASKAPRWNEDLDQFKQPKPAPIAKADPPEDHHPTAANPPPPATKEEPPANALTIEESPPAHEAPPPHTPPRGAPAKLPDSESDTAPQWVKNQPAGWQDDKAHSAEKPKLDADTADKLSEPARPWPAFLVAALLLCGSLGANIYLGWTVWDARRRYRDALAKFRPLAAS